MEISIKKKKFTLEEILILKKDLESFLELGFKNSKISWDISRLIGKFINTLKPYNIFKDGIQKQFDNDVNLLKEKEEPKKPEEITNNELLKKYNTDLTKFQKKLKELEINANKKIDDFIKQEIEIEFKQLSYNSICKNIEKVIQPKLLISLEWLFEEEEILDDNKKSKEELKTDKK